MQCPRGDSHSYPGGRADKMTVYKYIEISATAKQGFLVQPCTIE